MDTHRQCKKGGGRGAVYNLASDCDNHIGKDTHDNNRVQQYSSDPSIAPRGEWVELIATGSP
jgi:hypothetical protein